MFQNVNFHIVFYLGLLLFVSQIGGRIANYLKAPRITGYLLAGIITGPYVLNLFSEQFINSQFEFIKDIALSIVAFSIGGSLKNRELKQTGKHIYIISLMQSLFCFVCVGLFMVGTLIIMKPDGNGFNISFKNYLGVAIFFGVISIPTAPAAIIAVVDEYKAKGKFTKILLGVIALDDIFAILAFSFITGMYAFFVNGGDAGLINSLLNSAYYILSAIIIGLTIGLLLKIGLRYLLAKPTILGISIGAILLTSGLALSINSCFILSVMVFGYIAQNNIKKHEGLFRAVKQIEDPIFGLFFLVAGAHLHIDLLFVAGTIAIILTMSRFLGKYIGAFIGAHFSKAETYVRNYLGLALLPKAGVTIALVFEAATYITDVKLKHFFITAVLASTVINEILTPIILKFTLKKVGDIDSKNS